MPDRYDTGTPEPPSRFDNHPRFEQVRDAVNRVLIDKGLGHLLDDGLSWSLAHRAVEAMFAPMAVPAGGQLDADDDLLAQADRFVGQGGQLVDSLAGVVRRLHTELAEGRESTGETET